MIHLDQVENHCSRTLMLFMQPNAHNAFAKMSKAGVALVKVSYTAYLV